MLPGQPAGMEPAVWTATGRPHTIPVRRRMPPSKQTPPHLNTLRRDQARRRELTAALRQRQPHAIGTWLLVAVNVVIYLAMVIDAGRIATFPTRLLIAWGALFAPRVADGEWWRLFTATFLHVHVLHIAFNMIALCMVGPVVERLVGIRTFLVFYVASGLAGTALSLWFHPLTTAHGLVAADGDRRLGGGRIDDVEAVDEPVSHGLEHADGGHAQAAHW